MKTGQASLPTRGDPVVSCFTTFGEFSLWWALSFVIAIAQCVNTVLYSQFLSFSLGDGHKGFFSPALPKQPHSSPSASALFWATATGCSPRGQAQAGLGSIWPRALPSDSVLGTAIIAGFTYFSLWSASHWGFFSVPKDQVVPHFLQSWMERMDNLAQPLWCSS